MMVFGLNNNQIQAMAEFAREWNEMDYFQSQLKYDSLDKRVVTFRMYKFGQPGWIEVKIDQNGDSSDSYTGGLD